MHKAPSIAIVDDNLSVRRAIANLVESAGFEAQTFASAEEFLKARPNCDTECLILDIRMPGMSGLGRNLSVHLTCRRHCTPSCVAMHGSALHLRVDRISA